MSERSKTVRSTMDKKFREVCLIYDHHVGDKRKELHVQARIPTSIFRHLFPNINDLNDTHSVTFNIIHLINRHIDEGMGDWIADLLAVNKADWLNLIRAYVATEVSMRQSKTEKVNTITYRAETVPENIIPPWVYDYKNSKSGSAPPSTNKDIANALKEIEVTIHDYQSFGDPKGTSPTFAYDLTPREHKGR